MLEHSKPLNNHALVLRAWLAQPANGFRPSQVRSSAKQQQLCLLLQAASCSIHDPLFMHKRRHVRLATLISGPTVVSILNSTPAPTRSLTCHITPKDDRLSFCFSSADSNISGCLRRRSRLSSSCRPASTLRSAALAPGMENMKHSCGLDAAVKVPDATCRVRQPCWSSKARWASVTGVAL